MISAGESPSWWELGRECPPTQLLPGPRWAAAARAGDGTGHARRGGPTWEGAKPPGRGRERICQGCGDWLLRDDTTALRMLGGWMHRECWLAGAAGRDRALREQRDYVERHRTLATYLLAAERVGGLPRLVVGEPGSEAKLVAPSFQDAGDNDCYSAHKLGARTRLHANELFEGLDYVRLYANASCLTRRN